MTISALLLSRKFYKLNPSRGFKYAPLGLLFVNVSVGGTLTHFAAPPVLMVAEPWGWGTMHMLTHFGWKAVMGIIIANGLYFGFYRKEFSRLQHAYALQNLKDEIEKRFVTRDRVEQQFTRAVSTVEEEQQLITSLDQTTRALTSQVRQRMLEEALPIFETEGVDAQLIQEAFDKRVPTPMRCAALRLGRYRVHPLANSNNVLRGGLTPKHVDVAELLSNVSFEGGAPEILRAEQIPGTCEWAFATPAREFELRRIALDAPSIYSSGATHSMEILIPVAADEAAGVAIQSDAEALSLKQGEACMVPYGVPYRIQASEGAILYKAIVPA